jgi:glycosyltransferase involved in cell wall biosynthesis
MKNNGPKNILIYIPAFQAEKTVEKVITNLSVIQFKHNVSVLIVDNASQDNTCQKSLQLKKKFTSLNISVFKNKTNLGYGGSQKIAYGFALDNNYDYVAMLHADAQYPAEHIPLMIENATHEQAACVLGSRFLQNPRAQGMPLARYWGNIFLFSIENLFLGSHYSTFHTGLRLYDVCFLKKIPFHLLSNDYIFDPEIIFQIHLRKAKITEISIPTIYADEESHLPVIKVGIKILCSAFILLLHRVGLKHSEKYNKKNVYKTINWKNQVGYES